MTKPKKPPAPSIAIPLSALDSRWGIVGTSGSGKTYLTKGRVEELLRLGYRVVIIDPLDVWFGLRLSLDGKAAGFPIAILGGKHGDLPLTEHSGAVIGEAVAKSPESCIVCPAGLKTSAARERFMLAFLDALYEHTDPDARDPYHVVFDEADLWAPQKPMGNQAMLCHLMEEIVRRGRVKGFIPWVITQRPAVINKNVLSQVDGLVAMKLTSSQDRDALSAWIEGQADRQQGKEIIASLPTLQQGEGIVWLPAHGILAKSTFPANATFDSSRTPKRGEKKRDTVLKPLDLPALRDRLATVDAEVKANDPKALKALVAELRTQLRLQAEAPPPAMADGASLAALQHAERELQRVPALIEQAAAAGAKNGSIALAKEILIKVTELKGLGVHDLAKAIDRLAAALEKMATSATIPIPASPASQHTVRSTKSPGRGKGPWLSLQDVARLENAVCGGAPVPIGKMSAATVAGDFNGPEQRILEALAKLASIGIARAPRVQVAFLAGYSNMKSTGLVKAMGSLRTAGLIDYPDAGAVVLTDAGKAKVTVVAPVSSDELHAMIFKLLGGPEEKILRTLLSLRADGVPEIAKDVLMKMVGYTNAKSTGFVKALGRLRTLGLVDYPQPGVVALTPAMFLAADR